MAAQTRNSKISTATPDESEEPNMVQGSIGSLQDLSPTSQEVENGDKVPAECTRPGCQRERRDLAAAVRQLRARAEQLDRGAAREDEDDDEEARLTAEVAELEALVKADRAGAEEDIAKGAALKLELALRREQADVADRETQAQQRARASAECRFRALEEDYSRQEYTVSLAEKDRRRRQERNRELEEQREKAEAAQEAAMRRLENAQVGLFERLQKVAKGMTGVAEAHFKAPTSPTSPLSPENARMMKVVEELTNMSEGGGKMRVQAVDLKDL